jgi:pilus assembly protein Flp/PilA
MSSLYQSLLRFLKNEEGPTAVEYAVMLALIVVVCITAIGSVGNNAKGVFNNVALHTAIETGGSGS